MNLPLRYIIPVGAICLVLWLLRVPLGNKLESFSCSLLLCLSSLEIRDNNDLEEIDLKGDPGRRKLGELSIRDNINLGTVSLACLKDLRKLTIVNNNQLSEIKLVELPNLKRLVIENNDGLVEFPIMEKGNCNRQEESTTNQTTEPADETAPTDE